MLNISKGGKRGEMTLGGDLAGFSLRASAPIPLAAVLALLLTVPGVLGLPGSEDTTIFQSTGSPGPEFRTIWSPGGEVGLQLETGGQLKIVRSNSSSPQGCGLNLSISTAAWRPDGTYALIVGEMGSVLKYLPKANEFQVIPSGTTVNLNSVSWRPDGSFALITGQSGVMLRFDHGTQRIILIPTAVSIGLTDISWSEDGTKASIRVEDGRTITYPPACLPLPQLELLEPSDGAEVAGVLAVRGRASVEAGEIAFVEGRMDSGPWRQASGRAEFELLFDTRELPNGIHTVTVRAWSDCDVSSSASVSICVRNTYIPPFIIILSPKEGETVSGMVTVEGSAAGVSSPLERVDFRVDGHEWGRAPGGEYWRLTLDTTTMTNGVHKLSARAWDGTAYSVATRYILVHNVITFCAPMPVSRPVSGEPKEGLSGLDGGGVFAPAIRPIASYPNTRNSATETERTAAPAPLPQPGTGCPDGPAPLAPSALLPACLMLAIGLAISTESGRFALLKLFFVPLYSRIKKDRVLDNFTRGMIYGFIMSNPGAHYNLIKQKLGLNNGSIVYHLTVLERQELIKSERVGLYKRFYPVGRSFVEAGLMELDDEQQRLLDLIRECPGMTQRELAERARMSSRAVNYHLGLLQRARLITLVREHGETRCYSTDRMPVC
ncbi:MAG: Ig-like domain-containing protein [Thermoplasmata archaeon]